MGNYENQYTDSIKPPSTLADSARTNNKSMLNLNNAKISLGSAKESQPYETTREKTEDLNKYD